MHNALLPHCLLKLDFLTESPCDMKKEHAQVRCFNITHSFITTRTSLLQEGKCTAEQTQTHTQTITQG